MDRLRSCYSDTVVVCENPYTTAVRRWYWAPEGAKVFPKEHAFASMVWENTDHTFPASSVGERDLDRTWDKGVAPPGVTGAGTPTPLAWFIDGLPSNWAELPPVGPCPVRGESVTVCMSFQVLSSMSTGTVSTDGLMRLFQSVLPCLQQWQVLLYQNDYYPDSQAILQALVEANYPGYARQVAPFGSLSPNDDGTVTLTSASLTFQHGTLEGSNTIYGWGIVDPTSGKLIAAGRFNAGPFVMDVYIDKIVINELIVNLCLCQRGYVLRGAIGLGLAPASTFIVPVVQRGAVGAGLAPADGTAALVGAALAGGATAGTATVAPSEAILGNLQPLDQWWTFTAGAAGPYNAQMAVGPGSPPLNVWTGPDAGHLSLIGTQHGPGGFAYLVPAGGQIWLQIPGYAGFTPAPAVSWAWAAGAGGLPVRVPGAIGLGLAPAGSQAGSYTLQGAIGLGLAPAGSQAGSYTLQGAIGLGLAPARQPKDRYALATVAASQQYVSVPHSASLAGTILSPSTGFWLKTMASTAMGVIAKINGPSLPGWVVNLSSFGLVIARKQLDGSNYTQRTSTGAVNDGNWHHVAINWGTVTGIPDVYIDGSLSNGAGTSAGTATWGNTNDVRIGRTDWDAHRYSSLHLDDVFVFGAALTGTQITNLAAGALDPATLSYAGWGGCWKFEEGTGTTTADSSGNGNTGTLQNGASFTTDVPAALQ